MTVKLLTEQRLEFLSLKGGCTGLSVSTLFKMPHCWKSHVAAQMSLYMRFWYLSYFSPNDVVSQNVGLIMWTGWSCEKLPKNNGEYSWNCLLIWIIIIILQNIVIKGFFHPSSLVRPSIVIHPSSVNFFSNIFQATGWNVIKLQRKDLWVVPFQSCSNSFIPWEF